MADYSRVTPTGWSQGDDASDASRATPTGWEQIAGVGAVPLSIALQADGSLLYKPTPTGGADTVVFLTAVGELVAKAAPGAGDRRVSLSAGNWLAS